MDLLNVISTVSKDKNLEKAVIIEALEQAVLHAARRDYGAEADLEASYNEDTDEIDLFQFRTVVESVEDESVEVGMDEAKKLDPESEMGDSIGVKLETSRFGRIAAQSAKQIIVQKVREAERLKVYDEFKDRVGEIMSGYVRRFERRDIIVDLGNHEAVIPMKEQMQGERFKVKDRIQGIVIDVKKASRGPQIVMSRGANDFLAKLFEQNVTEIYDEIVEIKAVARDPGLRSKIAVYSRDSSVDPVGACVGMKGARVQAIVNELNGEKIDIVTWENDPARLVCNALAPAVVNKVIVDEDQHGMEVVVADDQLSLAIGRRGQNVRLAAHLTGWKLDIKSEARLEEQMEGVRSVIASIEGLGEMHAGILVNEGIKTPGEIAELSPRALVRLLNLDEETGEKIIEAAAKKAEEIAAEAAIRDTDEYLAEDATAAPAVAKEEPAVRENAERDERVAMFLALGGVGDAAAYALADAGYRTIGDVIADHVEEVSSRTGLPVGVARTIQMAADRYLQEKS